MSKIYNSTIVISFVLSYGHGNLLSQDFTKITGDPVVSDNRYSEGASWGDINNDGYLDVFVPHLHTDKMNAMFINNGDDSFTEVATDPIVTDAARSTGGSFGDFDNDGDLDLFVSNYYGLNNLLYLNNGDASFTKITEGSIVNDGGYSFGSSIADYDNDGFLDIYVTNGAQTGTGENNFLYKNNGDATFTKVATGALIIDGQHSSASSWCDYDDDGDPDLFVANGFTDNIALADNVIYKNDGDGTFTQINPVSIGIEHSVSSNGSWADYDNDGDFDLFITNFVGYNNNLYKNNGDGTFTKITAGIVNNDGGDSVSSTWGDYDNDGDLDLYVTNDYNENNNLYDNNGDGSFTKITMGEPANDGGRSNGASWVDYNNDGYLDLFVPNGQRSPIQSNILYRNAGVSGNNWINVKCIGIVSNATAIGAKVRAKAVIKDTAIWQLRQVSGSTGFNAQNSFNIEFGLGKAEKIDSLIFQWPSGLVDIYTDIEINRFYEAVEDVGFNTILTSVRNSQFTPTGFELHQNFPNPFNPSTTIQYTLPNASKVAIQIYNLQGKLVRTLINEIQAAGAQTETWNGLDHLHNDVSSGIYFYQVQFGDYIKTRKMLLLR